MVYAKSLFMQLGVCAPAGARVPRSYGTRHRAYSIAKLERSGYRVVCKEF